MKRTLILTAIATTAFAACGAGTPSPAPASPVSAAAQPGLIVFDDADGPLYTANPDGTARRQISSGHDLAHFSHDGTRIAASAEAPDGRVTTAVLSRDGTKTVVEPLPDESLNLVCWAWTPTDDRIACEGWDDHHPDRAPGIITVRTTDWSGPHRLTTNPHGGHDIPGSYSPDGRRFAFVREDPDRGQALFVARTDGTHPKRISSWRSGISSPDFSPDSRRILFSGGHGYPETVQPDGTHPTRIRLDTAGYASEPAWSPAGTNIVFTLSRADGKTIHTATSEGLNVRDIAAEPGHAYSNPDWGR